MFTVTDSELLARMRQENPWWENPADDLAFSHLTPRLYLNSLQRYIESEGLKRAFLVIGPRRVGKTVLMHHVVHRLLKQKKPANSILFITLQSPVYFGASPDRLIQLFRDKFGHKRNTPLFIFLDEVQYLRDWEVHLKTLVDDYPELRITASGSAATTLRRKSRESGAGRFHEFRLPPLTFIEFLDLAGRAELVEQDILSAATTRDLPGLNQAFIDYLNYGGYPEAVVDERIRREPESFIHTDIIDAVLMRDLPQMYGIDDTVELSRFFATLAFNTGQELSLEGLTQRSGVSKSTVGKYLNYLEEAYLIQRIHRIDLSGRHFQRATRFKVHLTSPSLRAALFGPVDPADSRLIGALAETAVVAQWFHEPRIIRDLYYSRWKEGEVDLVIVDKGTRKPIQAVEVKWSDSPAEEPESLHSLIRFLREHPKLSAQVTTRTRQHKINLPGVEKTVEAIPLALYLYRLGSDVLDRHNKRTTALIGSMEP